ncbi:hypothetical protein ABMA27_008814 [Loxostege sticticalis]|uniref:Protein kinase domain-containing protein n=1 Tax=Loxostege sticticalis TaxID=481309 RepID=A0ABR3H8Z7_LOXSC
MYKNIELRKMPAGSLVRITETLQTNDDWKKVMAKIPKNLESDKFEPKYNDLQMRAIAEYAKHSNRNCAEILFEEWGTSGRVRPTLGTLQDIVKKAGILKAADEIALMLQEPPVSRPDLGPGAKINTQITDILNESKEHNHTTKSKKDKTESTAQMKSDLPSFFRKLKSKSLGNKTTQQVQSSQSMQSEGEYYGVCNSESNYSNEGMPNIPLISKLIKPANSQKNIPYPRQIIKIDTTILQNKTLIQFDYNELKDITCGFSEDFIHGPTGPTGKIGSGGFGEVYSGWHRQHGTLAVKKFRNLNRITDKPDFVLQSFNSEIKFLAQLRHENIVPIVGYSIQKDTADFPDLCIVCQYIDGGALDRNLMAKRLTEKQRLDIMVGTARGLRYIHKTEIVDTESTSSDAGDSKIINADVNIHGDVKTANILLTRDYQPKLCDFGLAKSFNTTMITKSVVGTMAYMSPERLRGTVTQKSDVYSFGIVLLELLTGLQSSIRIQSGELNIKDYVTEKAPNGDISELLDKVAAPWSKGQAVYKLAKKCLTDDYILRIGIDQVCDELAKITEEYNNENGIVEGDEEQENFNEAQSVQ